jgi:hypothetical protein
MHTFLYGIPLNILIFIYKTAFIAHTTTSNVEFYWFYNFYFYI